MFASFHIFGFHVGGQIAGTYFPFHGRFRAGSAVPTAFHLDGTSATITFFDHFTAYTAIITAPSGGHERTFGAFSNSITNQGYYLLNRYDVEKARKNSGLLVY